MKKPQANKAKFTSKELAGSSSDRATQCRQAARNRFRCSRICGDESAEWVRPRRSRTDVTVCVRGRTEFVEKVSADASHKKFSDKKPRKVVPRRRMAELEEFSV